MVADHDGGGRRRGGYLDKIRNDTQKQTWKELHVALCTFHPSFGCEALCESHFFPHPLLSIGFQVLRLSDSS